MTISVTGEFQQEFESHRTQWLRKRFLWYSGVVLVLGALQLVGSVIAYFLDSDIVNGSASLKAVAMLQIGAGALGLGLYLWAFLYVRARNVERGPILRLLYWLIVITGITTLGSLIGAYEALAAANAAASQTTDPAAAAQTAQPFTQMKPRGIIQASLISLFVTHFFACLFIPWTAKESIKPIIPVLILTAITALIYLESNVAKWLTLTFSPAVALPGALICWYRHSKYHTDFHYKAVRFRYGEMKRDLTDAQKIHDALFPEPLLEGPVVFDYAYEPNHHIGGDFVFLHTTKAGPNEHTSVVLIDVTGHGIPAALTVNRLHGELERTFGERPNVTPGEVLCALNSYVHFALATHSVYATAICFRVDPATDTLQFASGGHPPAFIRTADGRLEQLDSTSFVLGVCHGEDFQPEQQTLPFMRGDVLIACTDGATEARNHKHAMLRIEGFQRIVASQRRDNKDREGWSRAILRAVEGYRSGPPQDDTLIVELSRPIRPRAKDQDLAGAARA